MSFQITVLKVLAGHPGGFLPVDDLQRAVTILICSGREWTDRVKRLADRAPGLDIFSSGYVLREDGGWQITDAGRAFLTSVEVPAPEPAIADLEVQPVEAIACVLPPNVIQLAVHKARRRARGSLVSMRHGASGPR